ncbi:MAG: hypothetical protein ACP5NV_05385 [Candidatus Woesearchaeota archaeon]
MKLDNVDGIAQTILDEQIKNYFFLQGYLNKKNFTGLKDREETIKNQYFNDELELFKNKNPKIMNTRRETIARESYLNGANHNFP